MLNRESNSVLRTRQKPLPFLPNMTSMQKPGHAIMDLVTSKREFPHLNALHILVALRLLNLLYDVAWTSGGIAGLVGKVELAFRFSPLLGICTSKLISES